MELGRIFLKANYACEGKIAEWDRKRFRTDRRQARKQAWYNIQESDTKTPKLGTTNCIAQ